MAITQDFESCNPSSNLGRTLNFFFISKTNLMISKIIRFQNDFEEKKSNSMRPGKGGGEVNTINSQRITQTPFFQGVPNFCTKFDPLNDFFKRRA